MKSSIELANIVNQQLAFAKAQLGFCQEFKGFKAHASKQAAAMQLCSALIVYFQEVGFTPEHGAYLSLDECVSALALVDVSGKDFRWQQLMAKAEEQEGWLGELLELERSLFSPKPEDASKQNENLIAITTPTTDHWLTVPAGHLLKLIQELTNFIAEQRNVAAEY